MRRKRRASTPLGIKQNQNVMMALSAGEDGIIQPRTVVRATQNMKTDDVGPRVCHTRQYILDFQKLATKTKTTKDFTTNAVPISGMAQTEEPLSSVSALQSDRIQVMDPSPNKRSLQEREFK